MTVAKQVNSLLFGALCIALVCLPLVSSPESSGTSRTAWITEWQVTKTGKVTLHFKEKR